MTTHSLSGLTPGMILENDVVTENGSKLFPKGIKLTERHIEIMKAWDVTEVPIHNASVTSTISERKAFSKEEQEKIRAKVEALFSSHDADAVVREVNRIAAEKGIGYDTETGFPDFSEE